jgi:hypothetical protein
LGQNLKNSEFNVLLIKGLYRQLAIISVVMFGLQAQAKDCAKYLGPGINSRYVAAHLKTATLIKTGMLTGKKLKKYQEKITDFKNRVLAPTFPDFTMGFDNLVDLLDDLNRSGVKTGLCQYAQEQLGSYGNSFKLFAENLLADDGKRYYQKKDIRLRDLQRDEKQKAGKKGTDAGKRTRVEEGSAAITILQ